MADHGDFREEFGDEHPHSYDHTEPRGSLIFVFFGATVALVLLSAIAVQVYYERVFENEVYERVLAPDSTQLMQLRAQEDKDLHTYGYVDKKAGVVRLSIDRAMELVATESSENRVRYPTKPYEPVPETNSPPVSQPGAAAVNNPVNQQGASSSPHVNPQPPQSSH